MSIKLIYRDVISFPNKPKFDHINIFTNLLLEMKIISTCPCAMLISLKVGPSLPKKIFFCFNESPLKVIKNAFYFILKALFVLKIFRFLSWLFGHVNKLLEKKYKVNFKIYDVTTSLTHNCNTDIAQYLTKLIIKTKLIEYNERNIFLQKSCWKWSREKFQTLFLKKALYGVNAGSLQLGFNIFR